MSKAAPMNQRALEAGARALFERGRHGNDPKIYANCDDTMRDWLEGHMQAVITALKAEGFVVVPVEPTQAMIDAPELPYCPAEMREFWQMMIAAAQEPS